MSINKIYILIPISYIGRHENPPGIEAEVSAPVAASQ
jgi:hypothetical protein